jgi:hypothetical protein
LHLLLSQLQVAGEGLNVQPLQQVRSRDAKQLFKTKLLGNCSVLTAISKSQATEASVFPYISIFFL